MDNQKENEIVPVQRELTVEDRINYLLENQELIKRVQKEVLKENEHFGTLPGIKKPFLFKAGGEKLLVVFRLAAAYEIKQTDFENGHREYRIIANIANIEQEQYLGSGVGVCSTFEKKYRYRNEYIPTGQLVPKEYWDNRDRSILAEGTVAHKIDGEWMCCESIEKENPCIADTYNTVLKMSKKRALIDAVLTVTGASDLFTQDEDVVVGATTAKVVAKKTKRKSKPETAKAKSEPEAETENQEEEKSSPGVQIRIIPEGEPIPGWYWGLEFPQRPTCWPDGCKPRKTDGGWKMCKKNGDSNS